MSHKPSNSDKTSKNDTEPKPAKKPKLGKQVREEYLDASSNMRHYGNMRFAELTLFSALTAALLTVSVSDIVSRDFTLNIPLRFGGAVLSLAFLLMQERSTKRFLHYENRARELEAALGYRQHSQRPGRGLGKFDFLSAQNAARTLYGGAALFWATSLVFPLERLLGIVQAP